MTSPVPFADATSDFDDSDYVILGVPYDRTGTHRKGCGQAPESIRKESYNFETYLHDLDVDLVMTRMHDMGDVSGSDDESLKAAVEPAIRKILDASKLPLVLGGEHSISPHIISGFSDFSILVLDAHLDFREEYEGDRNSHACAIRRMSEHVGVERLLPVGVRSMCKEELEDARHTGLEFITSEEARTLPFGELLDRIDKKLPGNLYISLDMDIFDPAYAPGVGTPEPFGLAPIFIRDLIRHLAPRCVGMDVVEVCPPYDNGNTAALAAKLIRDLIGARERSLG